MRKKCLKRMAEELEEDQTKKRKKWVENLSVLSSEDEDDYPYGPSISEEKQTILDNSKAIYLRFPYYMGSDNSDDEDGLKYFPEISPKKREIKKLDSSSDEMYKTSDENFSYKHAKRKGKLNQEEQKYPRARLSRKDVKCGLDKKHKLGGGSSIGPLKNTSIYESDYKNYSKKNQKFDGTKAGEKSNQRKIDYSVSQSSRFYDTPNPSTTKPVKLVTKKKETLKKTSLRQKRTKMFEPKTRENITDGQEDINSKGKIDKESELSNKENSRFLDSSSENSSIERDNIRKKRTKFRRLNVLYTSSSSSDSEDNTKKYISSYNVEKPSENDSIAKYSGKLSQDLKPSVFLSSEEEEEEDFNGRLLNPLEVKSDDVSQTSVDGSSAMSTNSLVAVQTKPTINVDAWKNIGLADIKAQHNKQSKVEELKRKLVSPNAPSVAIYKQIQEREMLKSRSELRKPISSKYKNVKEKCSAKLNDGFSASTSEHNEPSSIKSILKSQIKEVVDPKAWKSTFHISTSERSANMSEISGDHIEKHVSSKHDLDSSNIETVASGSKKVRQAHSGPRNTSVINKSNAEIKTSNQSLKHSKVSKEVQETPDQTSNNYDVLGNIISQMDKNPFKIPKPSNKKTDPSADMLGWFPLGSNNPALCGQTLNPNNSIKPRKDESLLKPYVVTHGPNSPVFYGQTSSSTSLPNPRLDELSTKHDMLVQTQENNLPSINKFGSLTENAPDPSYNPLSSIVAACKKIQKSFKNQSHLKLKNQTVAKVVTPQRTETSGTQESTSSTSSNPGTFVPFYSAPQEDYRATNITTNNIIAGPESSIMVPSDESVSNDQSNSNNHTNNNKTQIYNSKIYSEKSSKLPNDKLANHEQIVSTKPHENISNNEKLSLVSETENINPLTKNNSNLEHSRGNILKSPQVLSNPFKNKDCTNVENSDSRMDNNNTSKGIKIRLNGKEYRVTASKNPNDSGNRNNSEIIKKQPMENPSIQNLGLGVNCKTDVIEPSKNKVEEDLINETMEATANLVSLERTPSSSSSDSSSLVISADDDSSSSSESSDDSEKQSSSDGSSSDSEAKSSKCSDTNADNMNQPNPLVTMEGTQSQVNSQKETSGLISVEQNKSLKLGHDCATGYSSKSNIEHNDEVILLSSSSDSDSNFKTHLEKQSTLTEKTTTTAKTTEPPDIKISTNEKITNVEEKDTTTAKTIEPPNIKINTEEIANVKNSSKPEKNCDNSNKVGLIRVKTLKELGVIEDSSENNIAQGNTQASQASQIQSKEHLNRQTEISCPSSASVNSEELIQQVVTEFLANNEPKSNFISSMPKKQNLTVNIPVTTPTKPTTIFLPVIPITVVNPAKAMRVKPTISSENQNKNKEINPNTRSETSGPLQMNSLPMNPLKATTFPLNSQNPESLFFKLCDELFTEVVLMKIPKLADDLHLLIAYDVMKEDRIRKIDQLISTETIKCEKRRAEKEFADMIKIRAQNFVPLFMTIVNKIDKANLKALLTAVYSKIVQQLELIDSGNTRYRFKIRNFIKTMLQKHSSDIDQDILTYFDTGNDQSFQMNLGFIEDLLVKYDNYVKERQATLENNKDNPGSNAEVLQPNFKAPEASESSARLNNSSLGLSSVGISAQPSLSGTNQNSGQIPNMSVKTTPPPMGNLDRIFLKRHHQKK